MIARRSYLARMGSPSEYTARDQLQFMGVDVFIPCALTPRPGSGVMALGRIWFICSSASIATRIALTVDGLPAETHVVILGSGELAELVYLASTDLGVDYADVSGAGNPDPPERVAGPRVRPEASLRLDGYDHVVLASLGDAATEWRKLHEIGVPQEKVVTLYASLGKQRQTMLREPAGARSHS